MKKVLIENGIFLSDKQIANLSGVLSKELVPKYASLIKTISGIPTIEATFAVDELTWHIVCREAAKRRVSSKSLVRDIVRKEVSRMDRDYRAIYPLLRALKP